MDFLSNENAPLLSYALLQNILSERRKMNAQEYIGLKLLLVKKSGGEQNLKQSHTLEKLFWSHVANYETVKFFKCMQMWD